MNDLTYKLLKKSLDASSLRQKVISHNLANINTKGYKRSEVVFEEKLKQEMGRLQNDPDYVDSIEPEVVTDNSTSFNMDGNNIDLDVEMANMAANDILYNTLVAQLNNRISVMRYVISEGRK